MKDCGIVKDLLPLVAEDMASEESTAFVEEHLKTCADCRAAFDAMQAPVEAEPAAPLKTVRRAVKKRGLLIAGLIACLVAALVIGSAARVLKPFAISSKEAAIESIRYEEARGNNVLILVMNPAHNAVITVNEGEVSVSVYTTLWREWLFGGKGAPNQSAIPLDGVDAVFFEPYNNTDREVLYVREGYTPEAGFALPRLVLNYYFLIAAIGTAILAIVWLVLRLCKKEKAARVLGVLLILAGSFVLAFLFAGFPATTIAPVRELTFVLVIALLLIGAGLCGRMLLRKE
ncbi:MAG: zf-HC2 domain-containing protein [Clostridia bacterium]|nr:zf-HC2 domain-containing protein [Clostridia bacterium]